jgi:hypothetical protein
MLTLARSNSNNVKDDFVCFAKIIEQWVWSSDIGNPLIFAKIMRLSDGMVECNVPLISSYGVTYMVI